MLLYGFIDKEKHMMTRPYFCSSNYLKKMSNYKWEDLFDGLYYNLIDTYSDKFKKIYSTGSAVARWNKFDKNTKTNHLSNADIYIKWLYSKK
jgi:deoxyribodipyrimidine photolyase-related protein